MFPAPSRRSTLPGPQPGHVRGWKLKVERLLACRVRSWRLNVQVFAGHRTEVVFRQVKYNVGLADEVFTERSLRRPPAQWISGD